MIPKVDWKHVTFISRYLCVYKGPSNLTRDLLRIKHFDTIARKSRIENRYR